MLIEPILGYKSTWRILALMVETPGKVFTRQELKKWTRLGNEALSKGLNRLSLAGILLKTPSIRSYQLSSTNEVVQLIKRLLELEQENLGAIRYSIKTIIYEFTRKALDHTDFIKKLILFGSVARGTAIETSDIDIAIITTHEDKKQEFRISEIVEQIAEKYQKNIQTHYFTIREFKLSKHLKINALSNIKKEGKNLLLSLPFATEAGTITYDGEIFDFIPKESMTTPKKGR